jgi:hypothetical protein
VRIETDFGNDPGSPPPKPAVIAGWRRRIQALQTVYDQALDRAQDARHKRDELIRERDRLQAELTTVNSQIPGAQAAAERAQKQVSDLASRVEEHRTARDAATARLLGMVQTAHPLVLLPVRLETRFVSKQGENGNGELLIRIYPDDIHIDAHEPGLTEGEERWGRQFWQYTTSAANDTSKKKAAWQQLADRFGTKRAAWIAHALDPSQTKPIGHRNDTWTRAPQTSVLPDRWVVTGYRSGRPVFTFWGDPIPDTLPVGPAPQADATIMGDGLPPVDEGMRWMIDFQAAVAVGMGLRIPLAGDLLQGGFERVVAVGVKSSLDPTVSGGRLAELLNAQHYTQGLAFVPQYTATNNTTEVSSGLASGDGPEGLSYDVERGHALVQAGTDSGGEVVASALGVSRQVFAHVHYADETEQSVAQAMHRALWPLLDSPFLRQLSGQQDTAFVHDHIMQYVYARGPFPSIRVGNQPYGLLPAASLTRWKSVDEAAVDLPLVRALRALWRIWTLYAKSAPHIAQGIDMPTLLRQEASSCHFVLTPQIDIRPSSSAGTSLGLFRSSMAFDDPALTVPPVPQYLGLLRQSSADTIREERYPNWDARNAPRPHPLLYLFLRQVALLMATRSATERTAFQQSLMRLEGQTVTVLQSLMAETLDLCTHRIDAWMTSLATKRLTTMRQQHPQGLRLGGYGWVVDLHPGPPLREVSAPPGDTKGPLTVSESNQGFVQTPSLAHAATAAVLRSGYLSHKDQGDGEPLAVDLSSERVHRAQWILDGVRQGQSVGALLGYRFERGLHDKGLDRYLFPFRALAGLQSDDALVIATDKVRQAEALFKEVSALYEQSREAAARAQEARILKAQRESERQRYQVEINAITSFENEANAADGAAAGLSQRIADLMSAKPRSGVHPKAGSSINFNVIVVEQGEIREWNGQLRDMQRQQQQASRDAVLARSKFTERVGVRNAAQARVNALNDRNNQASISAAQAEADKHDAAAKEFDRQAVNREGTRGKAEGDLTAVRAAFGELLSREWEHALESLSANNVVDGLELQRRWKVGKQRKPPAQSWDATTIPFGHAALGFPAPNSEEFVRLDAQLQALDEMVDAVSDVIVAESVYHVVQGNPLRAGATLDAIATGEMPPPELEVVRTPRTGIGLTHRMLILFSISPDIAVSGVLAKWNTNEIPMRAQAEPLLNAWAATLLGNPEQIRCRAAYVDRETDRVLHSTELSLNRLQLSPLDVVFMVEGHEEAQRSELEQRLLAQLLQTRPDGISHEAEARVSFDRDPAWPADILSLGELVEVARTIRKLIAGARAIDGRDLSLPEAPALSQVDASEFTLRVDRLVDALRQAQAILQALLPQDGRGDAPNLDALRSSLVRMASFGIQGAFPLSATEDIPETQRALLIQAQSVEKEVRQRLDRIEKLPAAADAASEAQREYDEKRVKEILGADFRMVPRITPVNSQDLTQTFGDSLALQGNDPFAAMTWFQRSARVREGVGRLDTAMMYADALGHGTGLTLQIGQLPYQPHDRWIALPTAPDQRIPGGRLSLVAHLPLEPTIRFDQPLAGLLIDEWVEVVPSQSEITGLTFHYDQPSACAPQAVLIAVPSDDTRAVWDLDMLSSTLNETLDLAKARAVSLDGWTEGIWIEDRLPEGATPFSDGEPWNWVNTDPLPFFGAVAHQSALVRGMHQHFFQGAGSPMPVSAGEILFAYVYIDPQNLPSEVMLQWNDGTWEHRAYWGANRIAWGADGTASRRCMGPLPPAGQWVRLEVRVELVGLEGREINGMAFTLFDGRATWDRAGKVCRPVLFFDADAIDFARAAMV